jgi:hypothetical protein
MKAPKPHMMVQVRDQKREKVFKKSALIHGKNNIFNYDLDLVV